MSAEPLPPTSDAVRPPRPQALRDRGHQGKQPGVARRHRRGAAAGHAQVQRPGQAAAQVPRHLSAGGPRRPQGPPRRRARASITCSWSAARSPAAGCTAEQYLALDDLAGKLRQRHAALHHAAGHSVPRRPQDATSRRPSPASTRCLLTTLGRLRRRGTQRDGLPRPAPPRRRPRGVAGDGGPAGRPPGAAHRRLSRNLAQRQAGERPRRRAADGGDRADLRQGLPAAQVQDRPGDCRKTTASTSTPRTSACWPSSRTAASSATTCWSAAAWA